MFSRPPILMNGNSGVLALGTITGILLAAPGATLAYRLVYCWLGYSQVVGVAVTTSGFFDDGGAGTFNWRFSFGGNGPRSAEIVLPAPGIQLPENTAVSFSVSSSAAGGSCALQLAYFLDSVS